MNQLETKQQLPLRTPFFYGWVIVFISALGIFFSGPGQTYSVSTFINSYIDEFGWSRSFVSSLYSMGTLTAGFLMFLVGRQIDKLGHRLVIPLIAAVFAGACFWMSIVVNPAMLLVGFFLVRLLGQGSMTLTSSTLTPQWFISKRGRAFSLMSLGGVAGSSAFPPINTFLINNYGWRFGWRVWAVLLLVVMVPLGYFLIRNRPEDVGLHPDGEKTVPQKQDTPPVTEGDSWTLQQAKRTRAFWLMLFCMFVPSMVNTGLTFHLVSILGEQGLSSAVSAMVLSVMALSSLPFTFLAGFLLDRLPVHRVIAATFAGQIILMVWLLFAKTVGAALVFALFRGVVQGFEMMNFNVMWPQYFGRRYLGSIRGFAMTVTVAASAFGPLPFGFAYDIFGGYTEIIVIAIIFPLFAIVASLLAPKPIKRGVKAKSPSVSAVGGY